MASRGAGEKVPVLDGRRTSSAFIVRTSLFLDVGAKRAGDDVVILFDGAGTKWVPELTREGSPMNKIYQAAAEKVIGA